MNCPIEIARARIKPRWRAAFGEPRWAYETQAGMLMPFTIEQSTAIQSGATTVSLGAALQATVHPSRTHVDVDGNTHPLKTVMVPPQPITISDDHDSSHMDLSTILSELQVVTGIATRRWLIEVSASGHADVHIAPSDAYIAPEIRKRDVTDYSSLAQWIIKYNVKATPQQLHGVFGAAATMLGPDVTKAGSDDTVLAPFMAPLTVMLHCKGARTRRLNVLGTTTVRDVLVAAGCSLFLHGVPLLPFNDIAIWRCCYYNAKELHLYDHAHATDMKKVPTLAGVLSVPRVRAPKAFVPYPTLSGNMFGDNAVYRPTVVARAVPAQLTREWLIALNASNEHVCFDHGALLLEVLTPRYGRDQTLAALQPLMSPELHAILAKCTTAPPTCLRSRYVTYVRCIMDLVQGTQTCPTINVTLQGRSFAVAPTMRWSHLLSRMPAGAKLDFEKPLSATTRAMMACGGDFLLEELRTNTVKLVVS